MLSLLTATLGLALLDWGSSYVAYPAPGLEVRPAERYFEFDPLLMWRLRPGFADDQIGISEDGLRAAEALGERGTGTRVFVVGGSTVFGLGVRDDQTVSHFLQQYLDHFGPDAEYEVVNAGVTGYYSTQELLWITRRLLALGPHKVIALTGRNDVFYSLHPNYRPDEVPYHGAIRAQVGALDPYYDAAEPREPRFHLMRLLDRWLAPVRLAWDREWSGPELSAAPEARAVFLRNQRSVRALLDGQGIAYDLFLQPTISVPSRIQPEGEPAAAGVNYLPALDAGYRLLADASEAELTDSWFHGFATLPDEDDPLFIDDCHYSELGARLVALHIGRTAFGDAHVNWLDLATSADSVFLGSGWHEQEAGFRWTRGRAVARLWAPASLPPPARFQIRGRAGGIETVLTVSLNGRELLREPLSPGQAFDSSAAVPESVAGRYVEIGIEATPWVPKDVGMNSDARTLGVQVSALGFGASSDAP